MKVFIADDDPLHRLNIRITLKQARDIKVIGEAGDGISAIEEIKTHHPDIVLMDVDMPGLSGISATRILRKAIPQLKIILNSISDDDDRVCRAFEAGADAYMLKSVEGTELISIISAFYAGHKIVSPCLLDIPSGSGFTKHVTQKISNQ
ncbi:MAG TPA: response regulator transcription factor [Desulfobacterales bacterium]|nr:response regulator transcription factor [Desulfobacterales bacterium]